MRTRNRYRNSVRLPVILFFIIVGGLLGTRWVKEIQMHYLTHRLNTELRQVQHEITEIDSDINSLTGRQSELITEDALERGIARHGISMQDFDPNTIITIGSVPAAIPLAQNSVP